MKIAVVGGTGYVGLCTGIGFAINGHDVVCIGRDKSKMEKINKGISPIYEPLANDYLKDVLKEGKLKADTNLETGIKSVQFIFICVGTPSRADGAIDTSDIRDASNAVGRVLKHSDKDYSIIVIKSTVVPTTTENIVIPEIENASGKKAGKDFGVCMNPEFLREGKALNDFLEPDRIVIGEYDKKSGDGLQKLYESFNAPIIRTDIKTAEMIKYASNAFLATKISFINEIGNICKKLGLDTYEVANGMGYDKRIGNLFLDAGIGFGGSCFPKDVRALIAKAKEIGCRTDILEDVMNVNERQPLIIVDLVKKKLGDLEGKTIAILGLSFKPDTDDIRESRAIVIIKELLKEKTIIKAYDPKAMTNMKAVFPQIIYCKAARDAIEDSDACIITTAWEEFKKLDNKDFDKMRKRIMIEGRRILDRKKVSGFEGICW